MSQQERAVNRTVGLINDLIKAVAAANEWPGGIREIPQGDRSTTRKLLNRARQWVASGGEDTYAKPRLIHLVHTYPRITRGAIRMLKARHKVDAPPKPVVSKRTLRNRKKRRGK